MEKKQKDTRTKRKTSGHVGYQKSGKDKSKGRGKKLSFHEKMQLPHRNSLRIKKGDTVVVLAGKYKGVKGKVLKAFPKDNNVIVEKVNFIKKHTRPSQQNQQGGIVEKEAPIHVSNVKLFNEKLGDVTRAVFKQVGKNRIRVCKKTGDEL